MRRPVSHGMRYAPNDRRAFKHKKRRPAMKKISTLQVFGNEILKEQKLTIGLDLGDRWSFYCVLDEAEREVGRGIERGVARGSGAAIERGRIAERAHPGIRPADGENRQGSVPGSGLAQASEAGRNADRADLCPDDTGPVSVPEESRGR